MHFGTTLRLLRLDAGLSLRDLASRVGVSNAYLSRVENGHDPVPTSERLIAIAGALGVPPVLLLDLAQRAGPAVMGYMERVPAAGALFLEIARRGLSAAQIGRVEEFIDTEFPAADRNRHTPRLVDRLSPSSVVLRLVCTDMEDLVDIAVSRLPGVPPEKRRDVAQRVLAREREASTAIGGGFAAPHAIVPFMPDAAVLLTLAEPLPIDTPDGQPLRVAIVLVSAEPGAVHLEMLARIARLASYSIAAELASAESPEQILAAIESAEGLW